MTDVRENVVNLGSCFGDLFTDWLAEAQKYIDQVPEEFRDKVRIDIDSYDDYGNAYASVDLFYYRPQTAIERKAAEAREEVARSFREKAEREQLAKLKAKYDD